MATDNPVGSRPAAPAVSGKSAGRLIVTITLFLGLGGGLVALYFGRELVEARKARMAPRNPPAGAVLPPADQGVR